MLRRVHANLTFVSTPASDATAALERDGYTMLRGVFEPDAVALLRAEVDDVFDRYPPERLRDDKVEFRYEMLNRSAACQEAVGHARILEVVEPLLGDDCHVIANTAWRNPPEFEGGPWHCDAGPHIPRPPDVDWDDRIPYPVFAVATHVMLADCGRDDGPTAVLARSHRSGRLPPYESMFSDDLTYDGDGPVVLEVSAGDVLLFVSDVWHRGLPAVEGRGRGRYFLQAHYGRRDIAQRLRPTAESHQLSPDAVARATTARARTLAGLHDPFFYDA